MTASHERNNRASEESTVSDELLSLLAERGITAHGEVELRLELERHAPSYTLVRLTPAAARKWKARYRLLLATEILDAQTVAEAYARAILSACASSERDTPTTDA